jgi:hypothetical protein
MKPKSGGRLFDYTKAETLHQYTIDQQSQDLIHLLQISFRRAS